MNKFKPLFLIVLIPILLISIIGCSDDDKDTLSSASAASFIESINPPNGSVGVATVSSISITFSTTMDTMSVMNNFHFSGGDEMYDWMDSVAHSGGMGSMGMGQMDHMMDIMDSIQVSGEFHWNSTGDSCEYILSDSMMSNTEYMINMDENEMMNNDGSMMGMNMNHDDDGYHQSHFTTSP